MQLQFRRIRFSKEADIWLRHLKARTGVTPNLLCRIAICMSLAEPGDPTTGNFDEDSEREINRSTLLGDFDQTLSALVKQRYFEDAGTLPRDDFDNYFRAHVHRGVLLLASRAKSLADLVGLFR